MQQTRPGWLWIARHVPYCTVPYTSSCCAVFTAEPDACRAAGVLSGASKEQNHWEKKLRYPTSSRFFSWKFLLYSLVDDYFCTIYMVLARVTRFKNAFLVVIFPVVGRFLCISHFRSYFRGSLKFVNWWRLSVSCGRSGHVGPATIIRKRNRTCIV